MNCWANWTKVKSTRLSNDMEYIMLHLYRKSSEPSAECLQVAGNFIDCYSTQHTEEKRCSRKKEKS